MLPTRSSLKRTPTDHIWVGVGGDGTFIMFIPEEKEEKWKSAASGE